MKNYLLLACLLMTSFALQAQNNVVKLGLGSAVISRDVNLKYERAFGNHHSVQLSFLYDTKESFGSSAILSVDDLDGLPVSLGGIAITPEYRYYFKDEEGPRGFYAGLYGRYRTRNLAKDGDFGTDVDFDAKINITNFGGGIGCGYQWLISDAFVIDWYIGGLGFNVYGARIVASPKNPNDVDELKMEALTAVNDFDLDGIDTQGAADLQEFKDALITEIEGLSADDLDIKTPRISQGLIEIRAGLSIGYAF